MKKILFVLFAALAFVACEKEEPSDNNLLYAGGDIKFYQNSEQIHTLYFDKEKGGTITIETEVDAFVAGLGGQKGTEYITKSFYEYDIPAPEYIITLEQILKHKEFVIDDCKIVPNGFRKFTITVEPNSEYSQYNICFSKIIESKEHGKIAEHGGTTIPIVPK